MKLICRFVLLFYTAAFSFIVHSQPSYNSVTIPTVPPKDSLILLYTKNTRQFFATANFLDAEINSISTFNSLIKKEAYRIKITSFNNPTSSNMGFNLQHEVQAALKPLLDKTRNTDQPKFKGVINSLLSSNATSGLGRTLSLVNPIFPSLLSLVGNLTVHERRITKEDLDSFITATSKYFLQYEKLNLANTVFEQNIDLLSNKLKDVEMDLKEYLLDMVTILYKNAERNSLKIKTYEAIFLQYLDRQTIEDVWEKNSLSGTTARYPTDGIKSAKDLAYNLQKLFNDYQKVYTDNYTQVRAVLIDAKKLGKTINTQQVDASLTEVADLYDASKNSDVLSLRFNTLFERLKTLAATEQK